MTPLDRLRERWAKAAPGPWYIDRQDGERGEIHRHVCSGPSTIATVSDDTYPEGRQSMAILDAEAIAHAPVDVAALLRVVEAVLRAVEEGLDDHEIADGVSAALAPLLTTQEEDGRG